MQLVVDYFLPERDHVMFGSLLLQIRLSVSSVCNVLRPWRDEGCLEIFPPLGANDLL